MTAIANYKYFYIQALPLPEGRKTPTFVVINRSSETPIGRIKWYGPWRQYCFYPHGDTVWSDGCLADIQAFIRTHKEARRKRQ